MSADKVSPTRLAAADASREQSAISDDITRIVGYLNQKRSIASERTSGLAQEIAHRRDELSEGAARRELADNAVETPSLMTDGAGKETRSNPALAERYHTFCRDLDVLLDTFRARVEGKKQIRH